MPRRTSAAAFTRIHRARFVYHQRAALQFAAVTPIYRALRGFIIAYLDKSEPARLTGEPIPHHGHGVHCNACTFKKALDVVLVG